METETFSPSTTDTTENLKLNRHFNVSVKSLNSLGERLAKALEDAVNNNDKTKHVLQLNFDEFNLFAVRAGKHYEDLAKEEEKFIVSHYDFVELRSNDGKIVRFAIWQRLKSSNILR